MRTFLVSPADPGRFRFGASALWETIHAVRALRDPRQQRYHRPWLAGVTPQDVLARLPALTALTPVRGYTPGFLSPPPREGQRPDPAQELAHLRVTPIPEVGAGLAEAAGRARSPEQREALGRLALAPGAALDAIVVELMLAWDELVDPWWPSIRALIDDDLAHRSLQILRHGMAFAINDLNRRIRWDGDHIQITESASRTSALDGRGLLFMPTAFGWPHIISPDHPWPPTIAYPARGIGLLWATGQEPTDALSRLLGPQRARVLTSLASPATTTELARRLQLTPASVSRHLTLMHAAGLVTRRRDGHHVFYQRTALGTTLVTGTHLHNP